MNYNIFMDKLEKSGLLTSAWTGIAFNDLPDDVKKDIELLVSELRVEFKYEDGAQS